MLVWLLLIGPIGPVVQGSPLWLDHIVDRFRTMGLYYVPPPWKTTTSPPTPPTTTTPPPPTSGPVSGKTIARNRWYRPFVTHGTPIKTSWNSMVHPSGRVWQTDRRMDSRNYNATPWVPRGANNLTYVDAIVYCSQCGKQFNTVK
jgi:hypothetical protein